MSHELVQTKTALSKGLLAAHKAQLANRQKKKQAGQFDYNVMSVGKTPDGRVEVWFGETILGGPSKVAAAVLAAMPGIMDLNDTLFGVKGASGHVLLVALGGQTDGSTGAYHYGCGFDFQGAGYSDWYIDIALQSFQKTLGLVQAEVSESFMGLQNKGWDCGYSNGEGLSRLLANDQSGGPGGPLHDFETFPSWQQAGSPNWIDQTELTDQNPVSTGCAIGYLYWMRSLGYPLAAVIQAGCPNGALASNYQALTGKTTCWVDFQAAVKALGMPISSDNPWPAPSTPPKLLSTAPASKGPTITLASSLPAGTYSLVSADAVKPDGFFALDALDAMIYRLTKLRDALHGQASGPK